MNTGKRAAALLWFAILALGLTACTEHKPVPPPDVKLNPARKERYEIILTVLDDPGPINSVSGRAQFNIRNLDCVPIDYGKAIGGITPNYDTYSKISFSRNGTDSYVGYVYSDLYASGDYYGIGTCHWALTALNVKIGTHDVIQNTSAKGSSIISLHETVNDCPLPGVSKSSIMDACFLRSETIDRAVIRNDSLYRVSIKSRRK